MQSALWSGLRLLILQKIPESCWKLHLDKPAAIIELKWNKNASGAIAQAMIDARVQQNMTQKDLSAKTGITQADISRIENGTRNPSLSMVKKLAQGLGMQLKLEFVPMPTKN